jgi:murein DD-endopeptidase MepM/ murein hydrolase activator NlpD
MVDLRFPLEPGRYYVANGGSNTTVSSHAATLAQATPRQRQYFGQSHAVDIVAIGRWGLPSTGLNPPEPKRYRIFGARVLAPCEGSVVLAVDGKPDMRVPVMDSANMAGNHVLLRCGGADILLAHLRRESVSVAAGDVVRAGRVLGQVGNSGNSALPHLHIHAQRRGTVSAPLSGTPLPMRVNGQYLVRGDRPSGRGE